VTADVSTLDSSLSLLGKCTALHRTNSRLLHEQTLAMKYVATAALIVAFASPSLAGSGAYYVGLRLGGRSCTVMTHAPNPKKYKMMGKYGTRSEANKAITGMTECH
jgi:hypothetical protein